MAEPPQKPSSHRWYQFSLSRLFLVTTLVSVLVAGWAGLMRSEGPMPLGFYLLMIVAAPLAMVILLSLFQALLRFLERR